MLRLSNDDMRKRVILSVRIDFLPGNRNLLPLPKD